MKVLERLPVMTDAELLRLAENARTGLGRSHQRADAELVLDAVEQERRRRGVVQAEAGEKEQKAIRARMDGLPLQQRVTAAFSERAPVAWELRALRALANNEGLTTEGLSTALGFSGGYMNMAFGTLCHDRQAWLGPPPKARRAGQVIFSALLVDFTERRDEQTGTSWTEWRLKPEALEGLRLAGVIH